MSVSRVHPSLRGPSINPFLDVTVQMMRERNGGPLEERGAVLRFRHESSPSSKPRCSSSTSSSSDDEPRLNPGSAIRSNTAGNPTHQPFANPLRSRSPEHHFTEVVRRLSPSLGNDQSMMVAAHHAPLRYSAEQILDALSDDHSLDSSWHDEDLDYAAAAANKKEKNPSSAGDDLIVFEELPSVRQSSSAPPPIPLLFDSVSKRYREPSPKQLFVPVQQPQSSYSSTSHSNKKKTYVSPLVEIRESKDSLPATNVSYLQSNAALSSSKSNPVPITAAVASTPMMRARHLLPPTSSSRVSESSPLDLTVEQFLERTSKLLAEGQLLDSTPPKANDQPPPQQQPYSSQSTTSAIKKNEPSSFGSAAVEVNASPKEPNRIAAASSQRGQFSVERPSSSSSSTVSPPAPALAPQQKLSSPLPAAAAAPSPKQPSPPVNATTPQNHDSIVFTEVVATPVNDTASQKRELRPLSQPAVPTEAKSVTIVQQGSESSRSINQEKPPHPLRQQPQHQQQAAAAAAPLPCAPIEEEKEEEVHLVLSGRSSRSGSPPISPPSKMETLPEVEAKPERNDGHALKKVPSSTNGSSNAKKVNPPPSPPPKRTTAAAAASGAPHPPVKKPIAHHAAAVSNNEVARDEKQQTKSNEEGHQAQEELPRFSSGSLKLIRLPSSETGLAGSSLDKHPLPATAATPPRGSQNGAVASSIPRETSPSQQISEFHSSGSIRCDRLPSEPSTSAKQPIATNHADQTVSSCDPMLSAEELERTATFKSSGSLRFIKVEESRNVSSDEDVPSGSQTPRREEEAPRRRAMPPPPPNHAPPDERTTTVNTPRNPYSSSGNLKVARQSPPRETTVDVAPSASQPSPSPSIFSSSGNLRLQRQPSAERPVQQEPAAEVRTHADPSEFPATFSSSGNLRVSKSNYVAPSSSASLSSPLPPSQRPIEHQPPAPVPPSLLPPPREPRENSNNSNTTPIGSRRTSGAAESPFAQQHNGSIPTINSIIRSRSGAGPGTPSLIGGGGPGRATVSPDQEDQTSAAHHHRPFVSNASPFGPPRPDDIFSGQPSQQSSRVVPMSFRPTSVGRGPAPSSAVSRSVFA